MGWCDIFIMTDLSVKVGQYNFSTIKLEELDNFARGGFERLQNVFLTKELNDIHPVSEAYSQLEQGLSTMTKQVRYVHWDRKMQEALFLDKYILQLVIGHESVRQLYTRLPHRSLFLQQMSVSQEMMITPRDDYTVRSLQYKEVLYRQVHDQIYHLIKNEKYDFILEAMKEIRAE